MDKIQAIAIFDVGKTNKKFLLFDKRYKVVYEESTQLTETEDEDGFPCEDVFALTDWVRSRFIRMETHPQFEIKAVNFAAYGASFVYLDENLAVVPPLYNYIKPYPEELLRKFYTTYGGESLFSKTTASPVLGNLNSGMQLYRLKYQRPDTFARIRYALHLPQYLSFVLTTSLHSDITSIGCHTNLWNFPQRKYHEWVTREGVLEKLPGILPCDSIAGYANKNIAAGGGLHDSSAALIPYLTFFREPFVLLSTGTWCISLNPFNHTLLSDHELHQDCLCYLSYGGKAVKASRLFAGHEHEQQTKRLADYFQVEIGQYKNVKLDLDFLKNLKRESSSYRVQHSAMIDQSKFQDRDLGNFRNYDEAYHQLIADIMEQQVRSTNLIMEGSSIARIFVDGGFGNNSIYMHMLADAFPGIEVYAASVPQASALGAALVLHSHWNSGPLPSDIIKLTLYSATRQTSI